MPIRVTFEEQSSRMLLRGNNGQPDVNKESLKLFIMHFINYILPFITPFNLDHGINDRKTRYLSK